MTPGKLLLLLKTTASAEKLTVRARRNPEISSEVAVALLASRKRICRDRMEAVGDAVDDWQTELGESYRPNGVAGEATEAIADTFLPPLRPKLSVKLNVTGPSSNRAITNLSCLFSKRVNLSVDIARPQRSAIYKFCESELTRIVPRQILRSQGFSQVALWEKGTGPDSSRDAEALFRYPFELPH